MACYTWFRDIKDPHGLPHPAHGRPIDGLVDLLEDMRLSANHDSQLSLCEFTDGHRRRDRFLRAWGLTLDIDAPGRKGELKERDPDRFRREQAEVLDVLEWAGCAVVHCTPNGCRGFLLLAEPVDSADVFSALQRSLNARVRAQLPPGWVADQGSERVTQVWKGPRYCEVMETRSRCAWPVHMLTIKGVPLEKQLKQWRAMEADGQDVGPNYGPKAAQAIIAKMRSTRVGQRANKAFELGLCLGSLAHLMVQPDIYREELVQAAMATGLSRQEARSNVGRGYDKGKKSPSPKRLRSAP